MDMSLQKRLGSGSRALLVGLGVLGCCVLANLVLAQASSAAVPPKGLNCVASDGKISGRGSTYQTLVVNKFAELYRDDFCGSVAEQYAKDPAGNTMVAYNYPEAEKNSATGSGAGVKAASCRTDAFSGTDKPYSENSLKELNNVPGTTGGCALAFAPPFTPTVKENKFPEAADSTAPIMSFPIAGSSVTVPVNLTGGGICTKAVPTSLKFTGREISRLFGGEVAKWNDKEITETDPILTTDECNGAVTRVVRQDSSGTTGIFKNYLIGVDGARAEAKCAPGKEWSAYTAKNEQWPGLQKPGEEGECSAIVHPAKSGNPEVLNTLAATPGGIGYVDLPQEAAAVAEGATLITPSVQNAVKTAFVAPNTGKAANCTYAGIVTPPGNGSAAEAVGLFNTEGKNWAENAEPNENNVTDKGSKYAICGLTWDLVYSGLDNGEVANPIAGLTADQRRTEYALFTFVLSSAAQDVLSTIDYAPLPAGWLQQLREGFQENF